MKKFLLPLGRLGLACLLLIGGLPLLAQPVNDECSGAIPLTVNADFGCGTVTAGTTTGATASANPTTSISGTANNDVWFSFTATNSSHRISLLNLVNDGSGTSTSTDMGMALYTGTGGCGGLTFFGTSDPETYNVTGLTPGTLYYVRVYGWFGSIQNVNFNICVGTPPPPPPPPSNDECANAIPLTVNADFNCGTVTAGTTAGATASTSPPGTISGTANNDVWFSFTATSSAHRISLLNLVNDGSGTSTSTDMGMALYTGTGGCAGLTFFGTSDPETYNVTGLTPGTLYYLRVYGWFTSVQNVNFNVCVGTTPPPPPNDECADAEVITLVPGVAGPVMGSNASANANGRPTSCLGISEGVWYTFTGSGEELVVRVVPTGWDPEINISSGNCGSFSNIACADAGGTGGAETITFQSVLGTTYYLYVADWSSTVAPNGTNAGPFQVTITSPDPCAMGGDVTSPTVTCEEVTMTFEGCPAGLGSNTPSGVWSPVPADGIIQSAFGGIYILPVDVNGCILDDCGDISNIESTLGRSFVASSSVGSVEIVNVLIFRDSTGNESPDSLYVRATIQDTEAPIITTCPEDFELAGDTDQVGNGINSDLAYSETPVMITETQFTAEGGAIDEDCIDEISYVDSQMGTDPIVITRTFTVTDQSGQSTTCEQTITLTECIVELQCRDLTVYLDAAGAASITPEEVQVIGSCDATGLSLDVSAFTCEDAEEEIITVTLTQTLAGTTPSVSTCEAEITVLDTIAPVTTCIASDTIYLDEDGEAFYGSTDGVTGNTDNCGISLVSPAILVPLTCNEINSFVFFPNSSVDLSGNSSEPCVTTVLVLDTISPVVTCEALVVQLDEDGVGTYCEIELFEATDNCSVNLAPFDQCFVLDCDDIGSFEVPVTVSDLSGNSATCTATVTVEDNVAPVALCQNVTIELDEEGNASIAPGATGGGGGGTAMAVTSVSGELDAGDPTYNHANGFSVLPNCILSGVGTNTFYEVFEFTVDAADMYTFMMVPNTTADFLFSLYSGGFDPNAACTNLIGIDDDTNGDDPEIMIQLDLVPGQYTMVTTTFGNGATGAYTYTISSANGGQVFAAGDGGGGDGGGETGDAPLVDGGSTDACGIETYAISQVDFTCADAGANVVTLTVTDVNGNTSSCEATVTVEDNIAPEIVVTPQTVVLSNATGTATLTVADLATATDNCGLASLTASQLIFTCEDIGEVEVLITATDVNGSVSTAPVIVTVQFLQPNLSCIGEINLTLNDDCQGLLIPRMVLTGNVACLDVFGFDITVMDSDPSNGPIIDGCGSFQYMIRSTAQSSATTNGLTGALAPGNWDVVSTTSNANQTATATFTATTLTLRTSAAVFSSGSPFGVTADLQFATAGELSFDYDFNGVDAGFDDALIVFDFEGNVVETILNTDDPASGSATVAIEVGYTLMVELADDGFQPFAGAFASELVLSNFS
ncbi:hypothetical protein QWY85_12810, partial [Neolewinella lacunae]